MIGCAKVVCAPAFLISGWNWGREEILVRRVLALEEGSFASGGGGGGLGLDYRYYGMISLYYYFVKFRLE